MAVFVLSRTMGLPGSTDDIGNWTQTLGIVTLVTEGALIALGVAALRRRSHR